MDDLTSAFVYVFRDDQRLIREIRSWKLATRRPISSGLLPIVGVWMNFMPSEEDDGYLTVSLVSPYAECGNLMEYMKANVVTVGRKLELVRVCFAALKIKRSH